jgi:hypothetical protein
MGEIICKIFKNKNNGQLVCSLPKKKLPKDFLKKIKEVKVKW